MIEEKEKLTKELAKKLYTKKSSAIAICKNSIFTKKKLKIGKFNCKKKQSIKVIEKI